MGQTRREAGFDGIAGVTIGMVAEACRAAPVANAPIATMTSGLLSAISFASCSIRRGSPLA